MEIVSDNKPPIQPTQSKVLMRILFLDDEELVINATNIGFDFDNGFVYIEDGFAKRTIFLHNVRYIEQVNVQS